MKNCANCVYSSIVCGEDIWVEWLCNVTTETIEHPRFQGGPKKCECYELMQKLPKNKFRYPSKKELEEYLKSLE